MAGDSAPVIEAITPIDVILKHRNAANGRHFCVIGAPTITENKIGRMTGKQLFRGQIDDGKGKLEFFAFGNFPPIKAGVVGAILKGAGMAAGLVEIRADGVRNLKKPARSL